MCRGPKRWCWRLSDVPSDMIGACPEDGDAAWAWLWECAPWSMSVLAQVAWLEMVSTCPRNIILSKSEPSEFPPRPFPPCVIDLEATGSFAATYVSLARRRGLAAARMLMREIRISSNVETALRMQGRCRRQNA